MNRQELTAEYDRLSGQLKTISENVGKVSDDLIAMSSQQLCVAICGSLEQLTKRIFTEYARVNSNNKIHRPISRVCEGFQNPKVKRILDLVGLFDGDFAKTLSDHWDGDGEAERNYIDNLVDDRITIAHRKKVHFSISSGKLNNYLAAYKSFINRLFDHFVAT